MQIVTAIAAFLTIWCVTLFVILPFGIETEENPEEGWDKGAPREHKIQKKLLISGVLAFVLFCFWMMIATIFDIP